MLLVSFNYTDLQSFYLNEWFLIKHEHSYKFRLQRMMQITRSNREKLPQVYSVCQSQSAVTNPQKQILIN